MKITGNRKNDLLEDALSDSFFTDIGNRPTKPKQEPKPDNDAVNKFHDSYKEVEWERHAIITNPQFTYDKSLARIKKREFERSPLPHEYFSLLFAYHEDKLSYNYRKIIQEWYRYTEAEFTCCALRVKDQEMKVYNHVEMHWQSNGYVVDNACKLSFDLEKSLQGDIDLKTLDSELPILFEYLYSRRFADFPKGFKNDAHIIRIPTQDDIYVLGFGREGGLFNLLKAPQMASRGVKEKGKGSGIILK
ncbi:hypothetical protein KY330_03460 [Candidatus Woesearchaeota archaeon]|nr:hypothetical protein [Candidatus Woesearchaeota archaeon]